MPAKRARSPVVAAAIAAAPPLCSPTVTLSQMIVRSKAGEKQDTETRSIPMPMFGLGTFRAKKKPCANAVQYAVQSCGYRMVDTAQGYNNHSDVADGLKRSGVPRSDVFITTKVAKESMKVGGATACVAEALDIFQWSTPAPSSAATNVSSTAADEPNASPSSANATAQQESDDRTEEENDNEKEKTEEVKKAPLDLVLLHWPGTANTNTKSPLHMKARRIAWAELEDAFFAGDVRAIGVSNFTIDHLKSLLHWSDLRVVPAVNQIEVHPFNQQSDLVAFCASEKIFVQAYTSLGRSMEPPRTVYGIKEPDHPKLVANETVIAASKSVGLSAEETLLRWALAKGYGVIPKAVTEAHIAANARCVVKLSDRQTLETSDESADKKQKMEQEPETKTAGQSGSKTDDVPSAGQASPFLPAEIVKSLDGLKESHQLVVYAYKPEKFPL